MRIDARRLHIAIAAVLLALCVPLTGLAQKARLAVVPLPQNPQRMCTPTLTRLWDAQHRIATSWATWEGNIVIAGCLEHLSSLTAIDRSRLRAAFEKSVADEDLHLLATPSDGPFRAKLAAEVNGAMGRFIVSDWLLEMARAE